jgi:hypothetical protein
LKNYIGVSISMIFNVMSRWNISENSTCVASHRHLAIQMKLKVSYIEVIQLLEVWKVRILNSMSKNAWGRRYPPIVTVRSGLNI